MSRLLKQLKPSTSSPVLTALKFAVPFKLEVDASGKGAGTILIQEDPAGIDHPVCLFSKKFSQAQQLQHY